MPAQTTQKQFYFPDGCLVGYSPTRNGSYTDAGAILSSVVNTLEWTENKVETANAGDSDSQITKMKITGGFTLANLELDVIEGFGGGMFEKVATAASPLATIPDQDIAAGWTDNVIYPLIMETSGSDSTKLRMSTQPVLTTVTADPSGTPEVLVEDADYVIVEYPNARSGWGIQFISGNFGTASEGDLVTIDYGTNTPVAAETLYAGTTTQVLTPFALKFTHTDSNTLTRSVELFKVNSSSGSMNFDFKGANEEGLEQMEISYVAELDTTLTDGRQLIAWAIENGAA